MQSDLSLSGALKVRKIRSPKVGLGYKLRNLPNLWRGWWRYQAASLLGIPTLYGTLRARVIRPDGSVLDYGLISTRAVTTAYVNKLAAAHVTSDAGLVNFDHHASGTGTTAEAASQTALVTPTADARVAGTASNPSANIYRTVAQITYAGAGAITEHAVFDATSNGTMLDRSVFAAVNVLAAEKIEFTYELTCQAGG